MDLRGVGRRPRWRLGLRLAGAVLLLALAGCATVDVTTITLSGVVRYDKALPDGAPVGDAVQLTRGGAPAAATSGMALQAGDGLATGPDTALVISYPGGARAYVYPSTRVRIGSLIDEIGKVFIKVKGLFTVRTTFVTAGSEGTQYWVDVRPGEQVRVVVVEDVVALSSNADAWPPRRLRAGEAANSLAGEAPAVAAADPADIQRETRWVERMDKLVPVRTTISPWAVGAAAAAIGIGIWQSGRDRDRDRGQRTEQPEGRRGRSVD